MRDVLSIADPSVPLYVRAAAKKDPKWQFAVHIEGCWQLLTYEGAREYKRNTRPEFRDYGYGYGTS